MKKVLKNFVLRGLLFSGGGPLIYGIVILILYLCNVDTSLDGLDVFKAIITTYFLAFIVAGASVIWQEERLGKGFAALIHGTCLYICYLSMYLINDWIPKNPWSIGIFSAIFIGTYLLIWLIIYIVEKQNANKLNKQLSLTK